MTQKNPVTDPFPRDQARARALGETKTTENLGGTSLMKDRSRKFPVYAGSAPNGSPPIAFVIVDTSGNTRRVPAPAKRSKVKRKS